MKKSKYKKYFMDKKITVMGIGVLGRGVGDIIFLAQNGAKVIATDLKSEIELKKSIDKLKKYKNITYTLNTHNLQDFENRDIVLKGNGISLENKYINHARNKSKKVYMSLALLLDILKKENINITLIGVTGTKGKTTTTNLIASVLKRTQKKFHIAGNIKNIANLPILKHINNNDIILAEIDSWQLQDFHRYRISPDISVFTNFFQDHLDYYSNSMKKYFYDKSAIFKYHTTKDYLIMTKQALKSIKKYTNFNNIKSKKIVSVFDNKLKKGKYNIFGDHNQDNIALAYTVCKKIGINEKDIIEGFEEYKGTEGRLKYMGTKNKIHYYNDNNSTTPISTIISLKAIRNKHLHGRIILISGGSDKNFEYKQLSKYIEKNILYTFLFTGSSTEKIISGFNKNFKDFQKINSMRKAILCAKTKAKPNDIIVLSPASASFGIFKNEYERSDLFLKYIK